MGSRRRRFCRSSTAQKESDLSILRRLVARIVSTDSNVIVAMTPTSAHEPSGSWDSIHVFEAAERGRQAHYKLTSTVMLQLTTRRGSDGSENGNGGGGDKKTQDGWKREGEVSLSGSMTRQVSIRATQPDRSV